MASIYKRMELKFNVPDYLSIKDWKYFQSLEMENDNEKMLKFISYATDISEDIIMSLRPIDLAQVYSTILEKIGEVESTFFPLFELEGQLYGFSSISKMTFGEYIDLQKLTKNPSINLEEIMAILYRPVVKHKLDGVTWAVKSQHKIGTGNVENLFKYYDLEKYDSKTRAEQADKMKSIPVAFALGALSFFLVLTNISLTSTNLSLNLKSKEERQTLKSLSKAVSIPIGDGLLQFITSQKLPSLRLQGTMQSLT
jgi:hypothetical protein